ncbi:unnamed protein product [Orchesella dallaii]|uniref:G-protein coupled receptors family 2 profile 2 domain-containing protein n=1 Tax=Orchesella dallaii TaxID=48710 RepID=A0ABP1RA81_9HEXA
MKKLAFMFVLQFSTSLAIVSIDFTRPALQKCETNHLSPWNKDIEIPSHVMSHNQSFKFRVQEKCATKLPHCMTPCSTPMTMVKIPLKQQGRIDFDDDSPLIHFTPYGYFRFESDYFSPDDFCVYSLPTNFIVLKVCPSQCGGGEITHGKMSFSTVCVPKCCSLHKVLDLGTDSCDYTGVKDPWVPLVYRSEHRQICGEKRANLKLHYVQAPPDCNSFQKYFLKSIPISGTSRVRFRLLTNGTVLLRELSNLRWTVLKLGTYCLDGVKNYGEGEDFKHDPTDQVLLVCDERVDENGVSVPNDSTVTSGQVQQEDRLNATGIAYITLLFSGVPFLLVTAIVYILVWTKQNVHGWTLFSHTLAMLLHYVAQGVANTVSRILNSDQNASVLCRIIGVSNHYFVLASFCWLTIINYDLYSMFRHLKNTIGQSRGMKRFVVYMAIAWGIPFLAVMISVILDRLYGLYGDDGECDLDVIVPLYGHKTCYMVEDARAIYLYYPVGVLMGVNIMLAFMTFINMYRHDQTAKMAHEENRTRHRRKFSVMAKLFVVMGLVWTFEVIAFMIKKEWETLPWYLVFPDVFNTIQAVAIFVLFACQPKILNQVSDSYPSLTPVAEAMKKLVCKRKKQGGVQSTSGGIIPPKQNQVLKVNP